MKKPSEETMRKFVAFCDSGRPWYFTLGMSVTVLIVQFALWLYTVPAWFGIFRSLDNIHQARKNRESDAE